MNLRAVERARHLRAVHLYLNVIPAVKLYGAGSRGQRCLATAHAVFHAVLGVAPTAEVPPCVVLGSCSVEHDKETLVASGLLGTYLIYILSSGDGSVDVGSAVVACGRLHGFTVARCPCSVHGSKQSESVGEVFLGYGVALEVGDFNVVIDHLRLPRAESHLHVGRSRHLIAAFRPQQILLAEVLAHHLLHII